MLALTISRNDPRTLQLEILADAIEHDNGVVHRITDQGQQRGEHRQDRSGLFNREKSPMVMIVS